MLEPPVTPIRKANDGLELPATGFGTYKVNGLAGVDASSPPFIRATDSSIPPSTMRMKAWWAALSANPVCRAKTSSSRPSCPAAPRP